MIAYRTDNGCAEGERRKDMQLGLLEAHRDIFVRHGRRALLLTCLRTGFASADDVRLAVELPPGIDPRCLGSVPGPLAKAGIIRRAQFAKSGRPERHASYITIWELLDADAACRWLAFNPDIPLPEKENPARAIAGLGGVE
jgi:hypothetical protein